MQNTFTDAEDRQWNLEIDYPAIKRLRNSELQIDLLEIVDKDHANSLLQRLTADEILLIDVICVLLEPEIKRRGLDANEFAKGLLGNGIENAIDALIEGIANFSRPQKGQLIRSLWQKSKSAESLATTKIVERMNGPQINQKIDDLIDRSFEEAMSKF